MARDIPLGTVTLGDRIGGGGYGEVFKAKLEPFEQVFAVKLLNPSPFHSDVARLNARFIKEAEMLMTLRHPNITPIYGVGEHDGTPFILMEYFAGYDLYEARERVGSPEPSSVLPFVELSCLALEHAHQRKIVHRDIKPTNLLTRRGDARVVDFGIAQVIDPDGERFTQTGGTPVGDAYAAPELIDNPRLIDRRCDIYSLAACWFWLLTGTTPRGRNWEAALRAVGGMTQDYENVLLRALDQIDKRHQTMRELVTDVRALQEGRKPDAPDKGMLDDDAILVLTAVFENYALEFEPVSAYSLERHLAGVLSRFALVLGLRSLRSRELVKGVTVEPDFNNNEPWLGYKVTEQGEAWIEKNRDHVESLLSALSSQSDVLEGQGHESVSQSVEDDDIPF